MIVHDLETLEEGRTMVERGPVKYVDKHLYISITKPATFEKLAKEALDRGEIAVVVPLDELSTLEDYDQAFAAVKAARKKAEKQMVRRWVAEHPEIKESETEEDIVKAFRKAQRDDLCA